MKHSDSELLKILQTSDYEDVFRALVAYEWHIDLVNISENHDKRLKELYRTFMEDYSVSSLLNESLKLGD